MNSGWRLPNTIQKLVGKFPSKWKHFLTRWETGRNVMAGPDGCMQGPRHLYFPLYLFCECSEPRGTWHWNTLDIQVLTTHSLAQCQMKFINDQVSRSQVWQKCQIFFPYWHHLTAKFCQNVKCGAHCYSLLFLLQQFLQQNITTWLFQWDASHVERWLVTNGKPTLDSYRQNIQKGR